MTFEMPTKRELAFEASAAARVVRREAGELEKLLRKANGDAARFATLAREFYDEHVPWVAEVMVLDPRQARDYVDERVASLPEKDEGVALWLERLARSGESDLKAFRADQVRAVLADRARRGK